MMTRVAAVVASASLLLAPSLARAQPKTAAGGVKVVVAPLATLGAEAKSGNIKQAQELVARGIGAVSDVELVDQKTMLAAIKRAKKPALRSCDGESDCLAELGALLGADLSVYGEVGGLGDAQVLYLKLVDVKSGKELRNTVLELGPSANGTDGDEASARKAHAAAVRLLAPERYLGRLVIRTEVNGASVFVDGSLLGKTPTAPLALEVGSHALRVTHPEYRDFVMFADVEFDTDLPIAVDLQPYGAVAGDVRGKDRFIAAPRAGAKAAEAPWYRQWYTIAGGAALLFVAGAVAVGLAVDGVDSDRERDL